MKDTIRDLAFKATENSTGKPGLGNELVAEYMNKFAELIAWACADSKNPVDNSSVQCYTINNITAESDHDDTARYNSRPPSHW